MRRGITGPEPLDFFPPIRRVLFYHMVSFHTANTAFICCPIHDEDPFVSFGVVPLFYQIPSPFPVPLVPQLLFIDKTPANS